MKWLLGRGGLWLCATLATAAVAIATGQESSPAEKAERLLNLNCTTCHDLRLIQTQALDADGWTEVVNAMIQKGAQLRSEDIPSVVEFLAQSQGPLPDGPGKAIVLNKCTVCHDLKRVKQHLASPEEWADTLSAMFNEGLSLSDEEFVTVLRYLARNFKQ